jgi:two-component system, NtrC family, nitrogen regulation sensor histidine kinase NtrY
MRFSLAGRLTLVVFGNVVLAGALTFAISSRPSLVAWVAALVVVLPVAAWTTSIVLRPVNRALAGITDGFRGMQESDFSLRIAEAPGAELEELIHVYNEAGDALREERNEVYRKELLLDTILQRSPMAVVLANAADRVVYSNAAARELFVRNARLDGRRFSDVEAELPGELREILRAGGDAILTIPVDDREETFRVSQRAVHLNTQRHRLIIVERLTPELRRQEVEVWKNAIRIMNHELNNSLAPVSSLLHSARLVQSRPDQLHRLGEIYDGIGERLDHLRGFLEGYAQFARLPQPRKEVVEWRAFLEEVRGLYPFHTNGAPPVSGTFDRAQMQQVLINLVKNAIEAGSAAEEIVVSVGPAVGGTSIRVRDRGRGMNEETMRQALLPFYSTKPGGSGLGLALCNEIIEAHGGRMRLETNPGGGTVVTCWIP